MIFTIEHQCPQCGAPAELKETDRLFQCGFCRVKSYLAERHHFKYLLPHNTDANREWIYFPYWRFKGMLFACTAQGVKERFVDVSCQAAPSPHFPVSLGVRSQALKLQFLTREHRGRFVSVEREADSAMEGYQNQLVHQMKSEIFHQSFIGESLSLIYAPYYINNGLFDGVLDQPVGPRNFNADDLQNEIPDPSLKFLPTLCPQCGWDLKGAADARVLLCYNCRTQWLPAGKTFRKLPYACLRLDQKEIAETAYLPFWRIRPEVQGLNLANYTDLVRVANLPKAPREEWAQIGFHFWVPAFKVRPRTFLRLTSALTLSQPQGDLVPEMPAKNATHSANLPVTEAVDALKITLGDFIKPQHDWLPRLPELQITPRAFKLVYIPFRVDHHELIQPTLNFSVHKSLLNLAHNL